jgi:hypothetical protein
MKRALLVCVFFAAASFAWADNIQGLASVGQAWADTCVGLIGGGMNNPGDGYTGSGCQYSLGPNQTSSSGVSPAAYNLSAFAWSAPGFIKISASDTVNTPAAFPGAAAYGGWKDSMTITCPGCTGSAVWVVPVHVDGTLQASGSGAWPKVGIAAYEGSGAFLPNGSSLALSEWESQNGISSVDGLRNKAIGSTWGFEGAFYGAIDNTASDPNPADSILSYTVNETIYFTFPFTFGQSFNFTIDMGSMASQTSAFSGPNSGSLDFTHTLLWGGGGFVTTDGTTDITDFNLQSGSGFNYSQAVSDPIPEPGTAALIAIAAAGLVWGKRRLARG